MLSPSRHPLKYGCLAIWCNAVLKHQQNTTHVLNFAEVSENDSCAVDDGATRKAVVASSDGGTFREVKQPILRDLGDAPALTIDTHLVEGLPVQVTRLTSGMRVIRTCTTNSVC